MGIDINSLPAWAQKQIMEKMAASKGQAAQTPTASAEATPKPSKHHNIVTYREGADGVKIRFASKLEARRYDELMLMYKAGKIRKLKLQQNFTLQEGYTTPEGQRIRPIVYRCDFSYERQTAPDTYGYPHWLLVVEDTKGRPTTDFKMKQKMFYDKYGFDITVVTKCD